MSDGLRFPVFNSIRSPFPIWDASESTLLWILQCDPRLQERTEAVRKASGSESHRAKIKLGTVCLGGPFARLSVTDDHGRCIPSHSVTACNGHGYRNTEHVKWEERNGLVLIDMDDVEDATMIRRVLVHAVPSVVIAWVSARGKGLKIGVMVSPTPTDAFAEYDAWAAAYDYITQTLESAAGLRQGEHYRIDPTPAAAQAAILAHDPEALVRVPSDAVSWEPTERTGPFGGFPGVHRGSGAAVAGVYATLVPALAGAESIQDVQRILPWPKGNRTTSMYHFGKEVALHGFDRGEARALAVVHAVNVGLVDDYGAWASIQHFDNGWMRSKDSLSEVWGVL